MAGLQGSDRMLQLFRREPGTPIGQEEIAGYRRFASFATDQEIIDLVEIIRRWWTMIADFSPHSVSEANPPQEVDRPNLSAMGEGNAPGSATKVTLPRTATEIIELVRRAPEIFNQFSPAERLEAIRVTTSKRYRERLELAQEAASSSQDEDDGTEPLPKASEAADAENRVQNWFLKRSEEEGTPQPEVRNIQSGEIGGSEAG